MSFLFLCSFVPLFLCFFVSLFLCWQVVRWKNMPASATEVRSMAHLFRVWQYSILIPFELSLCSLSGGRPTGDGDVVGGGGGGFHGGGRGRGRGSGGGE